MSIEASSEKVAWNFKPLELLLWLAVCFIAAGIGSSVTFPQIDPWYTTLEKPFFTPPNWLFGPVWTLLFAMMAVAAWLVSRAAGWHNAWQALMLFNVQLVLNMLWSIVFFGMERPLLAACEILILWLAILATLLAFRRHSLIAAALLVPYLVWVSYAGLLNWSIAILN